MNKKTIKMQKYYLCSLLFSIFVLSVGAQKKSDAILEELDTKRDDYHDIARQIWGYAEMGYQEKKSAALLQKTLADAGFTITTGVASIPTAFIAEYGKGSPIIGIMGEYDALPGLSQEAVAEKNRPVRPQDMPAVIICSERLLQLRQ